MVATAAVAVVSTEEALSVAVFTAALAFVVVVSGGRFASDGFHGGGFRGGRFSGHNWGGNWRHHRFSNDVFIGGFGSPGWWGWGYPYGYYGYDYYPYDYYGYGYGGYPLRLLQWIWQIRLLRWPWLRIPLWPPIRAFPFAPSFFVGSASLTCSHRGTLQSNCKARPSRRVWEANQNRRT